MFILKASLSLSLSLYNRYIHREICNNFLWTNLWSRTRERPCKQTKHCGRCIWKIMKSSEEWSSQLWTLFMQLRKKPEKNVTTSSVFEAVTSRYRCEGLTNWAMNSQNCWMLHIASVSTHCCILLGVVSQSLKQLTTFLLFRDLRSVAQQSWTRLHSSSSIVGASYVDCTWFVLKSSGFCPFHNALQVPKLLGVIASICTPMPNGRNKSQHCWANNVGSCCVCYCTCRILHIQPTFTSFGTYR